MVLGWIYNKEGLNNVGDAFCVSCVTDDADIDYIQIQRDWLYAIARGEYDVITTETQVFYYCDICYNDITDRKYHTATCEHDYCVSRGTCCICSSGSKHPHKDERKIVSELIHNGWVAGGINNYRNAIHQLCSHYGISEFELAQMVTREFDESYVRMLNLRPLADTVRNGSTPGRYFEGIRHNGKEIEGPAHEIRHLANIFNS